MSDLTLVVGNANTSSWSLRPWLALTAFGVPFAEATVNLRASDAKAQILAHSPSGLVPALKTASLTIWDSLAIIEYVAERFPEKAFWPREREVRGLARAVVSEMHSGFRPLRVACPMNIVATGLAPGPEEGVEADIARIRESWAACLARSGGPFLFGAFSAADAFYAPVVSRFRTYGIGLEGELRAYAGRVWDHPAMGAWRARAAREVAAAAP
ncbi:MAG: glutathione S-transferase family protein [Alphaproteobacteria bacterium]|nr:glutathione S-transferase family protein [Alphaproteobacteria bacterium]